MTPVKRARTDGSYRFEMWLDRSKLQKQDAAELIGISPSQLAHLLSGYRTPGLAKGVEIEEKTGVPVKAWKARTPAVSAEWNRWMHDKSKVGKE